MNATTMFFTIWIGNQCLHGQDDVYIGRALATIESAGILLPRPTIDTTFEVVDAPPDITDQEGTGS